MKKQIQILLLIFLLGIGTYIWWNFSRDVRKRIEEIMK